MSEEKREKPITKRQLMDMLANCAGEYRTQANASLRRNFHMNGEIMERREDIPQKVIDALLVDFINYVGSYQGLDEALQVNYIIRDKRGE